MHIPELTLSEARKAMLHGDITCEDYILGLIERAALATPLNIWVDSNFKSIKQTAKEYDRAGIVRNKALALAGIPFAIKDNIEVQGFRCTAGTPALEHYSPVADAPVIAKLREAGALIMGKVGMHELAMGVTNNNAYTGPVRNPYSPMHSPGGSSGGSAAAVAARVVPASLGTDTGGSVRYPAAACNLVGLRPTTGRYLNDGVVPLSRTRDTVGPLARTVEDVALIDAVITDQWQCPEISVSELRIGIPKEGFWQNIDNEVMLSAQKALETIEKAGAKLVEIDLFDAALLDDETGLLLGRFEMGEDLPQFFASIGLPITLSELYKKVASPDVARSMKSRLESNAFSIESYRKAQQWRAMLQFKYASAFQHYRLDVLAFPTVPLPPPLIGQDALVSLNGQEQSLFLTYIRNTSPASLAGLPGISLPVGMVKNLPVGLELDAPPHHDRRLLAIASKVESLVPSVAAPNTQAWEKL